MKENEEESDNSDQVKLGGIFKSSKNIYILKVSIIGHERLDRYTVNILVN